MKISSARFVKSATTASQYPNLGVPEFAFYGKSNAGKSSLINYLTGKSGLVKTSSRPGVTQQINFFLINEKIAGDDKTAQNRPFGLVDLPGYGYAKVSKSVKAGFAPMLAEYCTTRPNLKTVFLLLDLRREPGEDEAEILDMLAENEIPTAIVGTKADKLSGNELYKNVRVIAKILEIEPEDIFVTSAEKKKGGEALLRLISESL